MVAPNEGLAEPAMWVDGDHIPVLGESRVHARVHVLLCSQGLLC